MTIINNEAAIAIKSCLPPLATTEQCVLHVTVVTLVLNGTKREIAKTVAHYLSGNSGIDSIHINTKEVLRAAEIKHNPTHGVGYPHADGRMHYFAIDNSSPKAVVFNTKKFKTNSAMPWQTHYKMLFKAPKGQVNMSFKIGDHRMVPSGCAIPKNGDVIVGDYIIVINHNKFLDVGDTSGDIFTSAIGMTERTLMECWRAALLQVWMDDDAHWEGLHESWYEWVEKY